MENAIRILPSVYNMERAVLAGLILEKNSYYEVANIISFDSFYDPRNAKIYDAIAKMHSKNTPVDLYTVAEYLKNDIESIYIAELLETIGTASHIITHAQTIQEKYIERRMINVGWEIYNMGFDSSVDLYDKIMAVNQNVLSLLEMSDNSENNVKLYDVIKKSLVEIDAHYKNFKEGKTSGIDTGIKQLTSVLGGGLHNGEVMVVGARPGMGKTAFLIHLAKIAALQEKMVQIYSLEMRDTEMSNRLIVGYGGINAYHLRNGNISSEEWGNISRNIASIESLPIWINDKPGQTIDDICINARKMHRRGLCDVIFIDYLQIISMANNKGRTKSDLIGDITRKSKNLAKELNVPIVLLSQLSRDTAKGSSKVPVLTDLRDSGEIEQDADVVVLLHRPAYYGEETYNVGNKSYDSKNLGIFIVAKNRHGITVQIPFSHNESMTEMYDYRKTDYNG